MRSWHAAAAPLGTCYAGPSGPQRHSRREPSVRGSVAPPFCLGCLPHKRPRPGSPAGARTTSALQEGWAMHCGGAASGYEAVRAGQQPSRPHPPAALTLLPAARHEPPHAPSAANLALHRFKLLACSGGAPGRAACRGNLRPQHAQPPTLPQPSVALYRPPPAAGEPAAACRCAASAHRCLPAGPPRGPVCSAAGWRTAHSPSTWRGVTGARRRSGRTQAC